jgi:Flp pilus assembly protein protease CpaA
MEWTIVAKIALSTVLLAATVFDLKTRRVPHWLSWPLLLGAVAFRVWEGSWLLPILLAGLLLVEALPVVWQGVAIAALVGGAQWASALLDDPAAQFVALWWGIAYALWLLHILGGGDVRVFMALVAFFPAVGMAASLWGGTFVVSVVWLVVMYRRHAWLPLLQSGRGISSGRFPSQDELKEQGRPTTPGLALGALVYLWIIA